MIITNDLSIEIPRMFLDPNQECPDGRIPLLYLLRRDLQNQYGKESAPPADQVISPLLTGLGIMVGFEVLTKLWSGNHKAGGEYIEKFLKAIGKLSESEAMALVQFRHALAHGYGLQTVRQKSKEVYSFSVSDLPGEIKCVTDMGGFAFNISIWRLKELFLDSIQEYRNLLDNSSNLQLNFFVAQANIGEIEINE